MKGVELSCGNNIAVTSEAIVDSVGPAQTHGSGDGDEFGFRSAQIHGGSGGGEFGPRTRPNGIGSGCIGKIGPKQTHGGGEVEFRLV
eukprot:g39439.t1